MHTLMEEIRAAIAAGELESYSRAVLADRRLTK